MSESICAVEGCLRHAHAKGWCKGHYSQARNNGGDPLARSKVPKGEPRAFFEAHVMLVQAECIVWPYMLDDGYGMLKVGTRNHGVHKLSCERWYGPAPAEHQAAHGPCHRRACFNGQHLSWALPIDQHRDMVRDGTDPKGMRNSHALLNDEIVREIRRMHDAGVPRRLLAQQFGVHHNTIDLVAHRRSWTHVE